MQGSNRVFCQVGLTSSARDDERAVLLTRRFYAAVPFMQSVVILNFPPMSKCGFRQVSFLKEKMNKMTRL
jgi:hypothetical protein